MSTVERRSHPRVETDLPLRLTFQDQTVATQIQDLSGSGIRFRAPTALPLLSRVQIALELPADSNGPAATSLAITGVVVRCQEESDDGPPFDTAIYFEDLSDHARTQLSRFVAAKL